MKLNWRQGILKAAIMGMETCGLYALLSLLTEKVASGSLSVMGLWLIYPLSFICNRLLQKWRLPNALRYIINGVLLITGILLMMKVQLYSGWGLSDPAWLAALSQVMTQIFETLQPEILVILGCITLWLLGWRLSRLTVTFNNTITEFQFGLTLLLVIFLVAPLLEINLTDTIPVVLTFFLFALGGMAFAHAQDSARWSVGTYRGLWMWLLLASIGLILTLGLVISSVITADLLHLVLVPINWIWTIIEKGVSLLASIIPLPEWAQSLPEAATTITEPTPEEFTQLLGLPQWLLSKGKLIYNILLGGFFLVVLWRISSQFFGWFRHRLITTGGAEIESLKTSFKADLFSFFNRIIAKIFRFKLPFWRTKPPTPPLSPEITSVRQIYRQLLGWLSTHGLPRAVFQTPYEYLLEAERLLPASREDLLFITHQYISARYSLSSPTDEDLRQLKRSWQQIRQSRIEHPTKQLTREEEIEQWIKRLQDTV